LSGLAANEGGRAQRIFAGCDLIPYGDLTRGQSLSATGVFADNDDERARQQAF
jgi:hypothetical protein